MNFFKVMNQKLDEGWKVTDTACSLCKGTVMVNPSFTEYFCVRCNKPATIVLQEDDGEDESDEYDIERGNKGSAKNSNQNSSSKEDSAEKIVQSKHELEKYSDYASLQNEVLSRMHKPDPSKKLGEKLLEGWMMLKEGCPECESVPLMRSRKGECLCVACDKFFPDPAKQKSTQQSVAKSQPKEAPAKQQKAESVQKETTQKSQISSQPEQKSQSSSNTMTMQNQSQKATQDAPSMKNQPVASSNFSSTSSATHNKTDDKSKSCSVQHRSEEDLQFDPNFFEMNLQNYKTLMGLINKAASDLTKKIESSPVDPGMIGNITKLIDAQTQIDRSQMELLKTIMHNS